MYGSTTSSSQMRRTTRRRRWVNEPPQQIIGALPSNVICRPGRIEVVPVPLMYEYQG